MEVGNYELLPLKGGKIYVRVSGPQVGLNKHDAGDRPCMYVFPPAGSVMHLHMKEGSGCGPYQVVDAKEIMGHEVVFHGESRIVQDFVEGCPTTGAILWIETESPITLVVRKNQDLHAHVQALRDGEIDDIERNAK